LEDYSRVIARKAKVYSAHAKRKTIKAEDIELALRDLNK
jgi:histone H3/H4